MRWCTAVTICMLTSLGCSGPVIRPQSPETQDLSDTGVMLLGEMTGSYGTDYVQVEAVSMVTGLEGTGGDPGPSPQRASLLGEMQRRHVAEPTKLLASRDTSLVVVRGWMRPGIQKGDRFDVEVRTASRSETSSLRNGWLMPTRMTQLAVLGNNIRKGHLLASAVGPVLVDPAAAGEDDRALLTQGRVLGGGEALESRSLGLIMDSQYAKLPVSQQIGRAINARFFTYIQGQKRGVATPKTEQFVEIVLHPRYKENVARYMRVVANMPYKETPLQHQSRLDLLAQQLLDPVTTATAALRLEAIGSEAVPILKQGIEAKDPEVRFYSAEALAYLDETDAVEPLARAARDEPAFRVYALAALSSMQDAIAYDTLCTLLDSSSAETRYGAFRALCAMDHYEGITRGENLGGQFSYHMLDVGGPPMIHVTRSHRPEIVMFGMEQVLRPPLVLDAGKYIMVNSSVSDSQVTVSRFAPGQPDQKRIVSNQVDEVIRAIVELGGTYPDVVQALQQAHAAGSLSGRFRVDALPATGREVDRELSGPPQPSRSFEVANPLPEMFQRKDSDGAGNRHPEIPDGNAAIAPRSLQPRIVSSGKIRDVKPAGPVAIGRDC
ncbi:MAG: flagellar basal body P-ring protein FlgI [Pirellulales bacterium]